MANGGLANRAAGFEAAHAGHVEIEQNKVDCFAPEQIQRFLASFRFHDGITEIGKSHLHGAAQLRLVIDNENGRGIHWLSAPAGRVMETEAPPPGRFFSGYSAAVRFHNSFGYRKAHSSTFARARAPSTIELLENAANLIGRETGAAIGH